MKTNTITNKDSLVQKIKKSSKVAMVIARLTGIIGIIGIALCLLLIGIFIVDESALNEFGIIGEDIDGYIVKTAADCIAAFVSSIVAITIGTISSFLAANIFKRISEDGLPFKTENAKNLKTIGILIISSSVLPCIIGSIAGALAGPCTEQTIMINIDSAMIGILFFLVATIFNYGALLQNENDDMV